MWNVPHEEKSFEPVRSYPEGKKSEVNVNAPGNTDDVSSETDMYFAEPLNEMYFAESLDNDGCFNIVNDLNESDFEDDAEDAWMFEHHMRIPIPKVTMSKPKNVVPSTLLVAASIQRHDSRRVLRVLLDSGGTNTLIHNRVLPRGAVPVAGFGERKFRTIAGDFQSRRAVTLRDIVLPEFDKTRRVDDIEAYVFDSPCSYDVILGQDFLSKAGVKLDFEHGVMCWLDRKIDMKDRRHWESRANWFVALDEADEDDDYDEDFGDAYMLDAKYESTDPKDVVEAQSHLDDEQKKQLLEVLEKHSTVFDGTLGHYKKELIHLDLEPDSKPYHAKPYPVPKVHEETFKKELRHLVDIGVLRPCRATEWAAPTFVTPKKDGRVRWVSDFRALNQCLKRKVYPLPIIQDVLTRRSGYKFFTKLDLTMMYYAFELDEESKELSTIVTPYGKFQYCRMAMGLKPSPDFAQSIIEDVLKETDTEVYIDDVALFDRDFELHMQRLDKVLTRLEENGLKINPLKCEWCVQETDFLGHWLTPEGIKPWKKKVEAILRMQPPQTTTQLKSFLGAVTYYRNMWPRRSHVLTPLTALSGKKQLVWTEECQKAFEEMKAVMAAEALLVYPDHNLPFQIYTDASDYQMGAAILQKGKVVAYWSRKLNDAQRNYSTMEKELLATVMCLKEFRTMLLGADITVYTDHKNLTFRTLNSQRVLRWRLFLEDFSPTFRYIEGKNNVLADCFSRLPRMDPPSEGKSVGPGKGTLIDFSSLPAPDMDDDVDLGHGACRFKCCRDKESHFFSSFADDQELFESFVNYPTVAEMQNPMELRRIQELQFEDQELNAMRQRYPNRFVVRMITNRPLICYRNAVEDPPGSWRICLPTALLNDVLLWYHRVLGHCGTTRLYDSLRAHCYHPALKRQCEAFTCGMCQQNKVSGAGYGDLPGRQAPLVPWNEVAIDLIGPWKIDVQGVEVEFKALTCIDPVTNLVELIRIDNKTAAHVSQQFENCWLSRYPRPNRCIHDNGGEFTGWEFQELLQRAGIQDVPTTSYNPQANAICERMHQTVGNILRTLLRAHPPANVNQAEVLVDQALATAMHAMRCSVSRSLNVSPGALVFQRDMILDLPIIADLVTIQERRQVLIDENLRRQNVKRRSWDYRVGQQVLIKTIEPNKLEARAHGPYPIVQVHVNGTLTVQRTQHVTERINIRRVVPHRP